MGRRNMNDFARERMRDRDRRGERGMRGGKYSEYGDEYDYGYDRRMRGRFMRDRGEYDTDYFTKHDIESWKRGMINEDGSRGEHFNKEQVMQYAKQVGVDTQKFGFDRPEVYADLAKAFLDDKDFDGEPEEKLYLYYKCIVEKE